MTKWIPLKASKGLDGNGEYSVVTTDTEYLGKSYSDYASDWFNWLISANANNRNSGPVVFLSSKHIPDTTTEAGRNFFDLIRVSESATSRASASDPNSGAPTLYINEPHIRIGSNRLQIFEDQAVFCPVGVCYKFANAPYMDWGYMQDDLGLAMDSGDNPPDTIQLTINNESITLPSGLLNLSEYRIRTPIFMAVVPDSPYGTSLKDFLEEGQIPPGSYPAMVDGYFVLLQLKRGRYWVHSWFGAGREVRGPYFSELLYQIEVIERSKCDPHGRITVVRPAEFQGEAARLVKRMEADGELEEAEVERFNSIQKGLIDTLSKKPTSSTEESS
jgi:hypothetical protein